MDDLLFKERVHHDGGNTGVFQAANGVHFL
jgi:hypothetical protein